jgi:hypothetical protein
MQLFKITLMLTIAAALLLPACNNTTKQTKERALQIEDSLAETQIDSAYKAINNECETLMVKLVPVMVDSLVKNDSFKPNALLDTQSVYFGNEKVKKVIQQLKADCDSNLLKETYKRRRLLPAVKPKRIAKVKN